MSINVGALFALCFLCFFFGIVVGCAVAARSDDRGTR